MKFFTYFLLVEQIVSQSTVSTEVIPRNYTLSAENSTLKNSALDDPSVSGSCPLLPINNIDYFDGAYVHLYSSKYPKNGVNASNNHTKMNKVSHEACPGGGGCKWIFHKCGKYRNSTDAELDYFVLENIKYRSTYLYANPRNSISHLSGNRFDICKDWPVHSVHRNYFWVIYKDAKNCHKDTYYLYSVGMASWLYAANDQVLEHKSCEEDEFFYHDDIG